MHVFIMPATRHQRTDTPDAARQRDALVRPRRRGLRSMGSPHRRGAKWGAIVGRHQTTWRLVERSIL